VGIKSTFGRVSEFGAAPLCWSLAHIGPLAANVRDMVLAWSLIAGPDEKDPDTLIQPAPTLEGWTNLDLSDLSMGVYWPWFRHAAPEVVAACEQMLKYFEQLGAKTISVEIPDLEAGRIAHLITIAAEMSQSMDEYQAEFGDQFGLDVQTNLTLARSFTSQDYVRSQRLRTRLIDHFMRAFEKVDVIMTPATGLTAPEIKPNALPNGDSDLTVLNEVMRFSQPGNMTGLPAIAFPVGYDSEGMPISMQAMGKPWDERTLFRMALAAEQVVERQKPGWHYSLLGD
jgi:Asp-tRNA(Asn)/Glu-tRNA(Gln) amidotransferase A subunit family amidase